MNNLGRPRIRVFCVSCDVWVTIHNAHNMWLDLREGKHLKICGVCVQCSEKLDNL